MSRSGNSPWPADAEVKMKPWHVSFGTDYYGLYKGNRKVADFEGDITLEEKLSICDSLNRDYSEPPSC